MELKSVKRVRKNSNKSWSFDSYLVKDEIFFDDAFQLTVRPDISIQHLA